MGGRPCIRPPNISRSTVIGCEAKYELTKKRSKVFRRNFNFRNRGFGQEKAKEAKDRQNAVDDQKRSSEILDVKWKLFS